MTLWTIARQTPLCMGFSRQEYWNELPFPSLGDLPKPGIKPTSLMSPELTGGFFNTSATWEAHVPFSVSNFDKEASVQIIGQNLRLGSRKADRDGVCEVRVFFFFKDSLWTKEKNIAILGRGRSMACLAGELRLRQSFGSRRPSNGL